MLTSFYEVICQPYYSSVFSSASLVESRLRVLLRRPQWPLSLVDHSNLLHAREAMQIFQLKKRYSSFCDERQKIKSYSKNYLRKRGRRKRLHFMTFYDDELVMTYNLI